MIRECRVGNGLRERTDVVERSRQRHDAVARHFAERRLEADDAARSRRDANRSSGIGPDRGERHAGSDARSRSAARSAGRAEWIERVAHRTERRVLARGAEGELVQVGFADNDGARLAQVRDRGRIPIGHVALAHP